MTPGILTRSRRALAGFAFTIAALALCTASQLRGAEEKKPATVRNAVAPDAPLVLIEAKFIEVTGAGDALPDFLNLSGLEKVPAIMNAPAGDEAVRQLKEAKGVDILSAPRVTTRSKQRAVIEIVREFRHATEWEKDDATGMWIPTAFDTKNVGLTFDVTPDVDADGNITMSMKPQVVEFAGFVDLDGDAKAILGKPGAAAPAAFRAPREIGIPIRNRAQAVFDTRKTSAEVKVKPGDTVVLGGMRGKGAVDGGREPLRRLIVMVTARIVKPEGIPAK